MSLYLVILIEAFLSTLWPIKAEVTAEAMLLFGGYDMVQAAAASTVGAVVAALVLWAGGWLIYLRLRRRPAIARVLYSEENMSFFARGLGMAALALVWLPMGFVVALIAGALRVPVWKLALLSALGCGFYYGSTLLWLAR